MHTALRYYLGGRIELSPTHEELVDQCFVRKSTVRNEVLVPAGAVARHLYFVVKGCLRVFLTNEEGDESTRFLIFEGQMGTAFPSFIEKAPSMAAIQSPEASELLMLKYEDREMLFREVPGWESMERKEVEKAYIGAIRRIEGLITANSKERYQRLMDEHPEMIKRLPSRMIADYLGISPETLSRLKAKK